MKIIKYSLLLTTLTSLMCCNKKGCTDPNAANYDIQATKNDGSCENTVNYEYVLKGNITENTTLDADHIWTLDGRVAVVDGVTLTIESGTIIKAKSGSGSNASSLIIARGAMLLANGTEEHPIIMTSESDDIEIDQKQGTSLNENVRGLWGGLIILGNAPGSFTGDVVEFQIEGIPASDMNGLYGGLNSDDNSGIIKYVSIRHGGAEIGEGNEINGLTLAGVGSNTTIHHIEVIGNVDDGVEFFGGTVNVSELLVWGQGDDGIDIDQGYSGTISNSMVILNEASDHAFEIDGPEGSLNGSFTIENSTIIGAYYGCSATGVDGEMADFRKGAMGITNNILSINFADGKDVELDSPADANSYLNGELIFNNWEIVWISGCQGGSVSDIFNDKTGLTSFSNDANSFANIVTNPTVGANLSSFLWTYANLNNAF